MNINRSILRIVAIVALLPVLVAVASFANADDQGIYGRIWVNNTPAVNVKVKVFHDHWTRSGSLDYSKLIAERTVSDRQGFKDDGYYELNGLPAGVKLLVVAIHPVFPKKPAVKRIKLKRGQKKKVILTVRLEGPYKG